MRRSTAMVVLAVVLHSVAADAGQDEADQAVVDILFDEDMENAAYIVNGSHIDIQFGPAVPEAQMILIVERLRAHPGIGSVLHGRGAENFCPVP